MWSTKLSQSKEASANNCPDGVGFFCYERIDREISGSQNVAQQAPPWNFFVDSVFHVPSLKRGCSDSFWRFEPLLYQFRDLDMAGVALPRFFRCQSYIGRHLKGVSLLFEKTVNLCLESIDRCAGFVDAIHRFACSDRRFPTTAAK